MKAYHLKYRKLSRITICFFLILTIFFFTGCNKEPMTNLVLCNENDYTPYPKVVEQILPTFKVEKAENKPYYFLYNGAITEVFDTQAIGALEANIAKFWYPHYLATVVIALDKDKTQARITSWSDLFEAKEEVSFFSSSGDAQMLTAAMAYGLEGNSYTMSKAINLLESLHDKNLLKLNSFDAPIIICYDYQASELIKNGRNIQIIIPTDGTFTYEKGLLSNESLNFHKDLDEIMSNGNLRLLSRKSNLSSYPIEDIYATAVKVPDYQHFALSTQNIPRLLERKVLNSKKYMSIDNAEHLYFALIYIIIVTIWSSSVLRRSLQKGIGYAAFFTGILLNTWTLVRLIKYQILATPILTRYLWYSFYIFQLSLPLVLLWMAWAIDKPEDKIIPPRWWKIMAIGIILLIILVFTNDLHGFVFKLDLGKANWDADYSYGWGYYIIALVSLINLTTMLGMLVRKSTRNSRRLGFVLPMILFFLFIFYNYMYIMRNPFAYQTDVTIVTGVFTMLIFESCIRSGLIPVNTKYVDLFTRSPLRMQIYNSNRELSLASASATPIDKYTLEKVLKASPEPIIQPDDYLLFANSIPGGYAIWQEDITNIFQLRREIKLSTEMLTEANSILAEEEKLKRIINEKNAKKQLMGQLESEIAESIEKLSELIEKLPRQEDNDSEKAGIALLLCYIKRRCNLFFSEKETNEAPVERLIKYTDELTEIASYSDLKIATLNELSGSIDIRYATLFYDFFYGLTDLAIIKKCSYIIGLIGIEDDYYTMRLLPSHNIGIYSPSDRIKSAIESARGKIVSKKIEDTVSIQISFPKGGVVND